MYYGHMPLPSFAIREFFHLQFLRYLSSKLALRPYAVKGGVCLRFFHRSPRLSEDIDLDIDPQVQGKTLQNSVDSLLENRGFASNFLSRGVTAIEFRKPKQTETTQRWKVDLRIIGGTLLSTTVEFSRRSAIPQSVQGTPGPELLRDYKMMPFAAKYYAAEEIALQKIQALAAANRNAVRDLFDLRHLFETQGVEARSLRPHLDSQTIDQADEKIALFTRQDFREQVSPFLPETLAALYEDAREFEKLKEDVQTRILEIIA
jgi:predicted nucleotidyltransferase component of viral defense system